MSRTIRCAAVAVAIFGSRVWAEDNWDSGCEKGSTEVLCAGAAPSCRAQVLDRDKAVRNNSEGGYEECKAFAKKVKATGLSLEAKKALKSIEAELAKANASLKRDFPFVKLTADLKSLEVAAMVKNARAMSENKDARDFSEIASVFPSHHFNTRFIKNPTDALYAIGKDAEMRAMLKEKLSEIRFTFESHHLNSVLPKVRVEGTVMLVPGIDATRDGFCDEYCFEKFFDRDL